MYLSTFIIIVLTKITKSKGIYYNYLAWFFDSFRRTNINALPFFRNQDYQSEQFQTLG